MIVSFSVMTVDLVDLKTFTTVMARHDLHNTIDVSLDYSKLYTILVQTFDLTKKQTFGGGLGSKLQTDTCAEILLNWLLNLFDQ